MSKIEGDKVIEKLFQRMDSLEKAVEQLRTARLALAPNRECFTRAEVAEMAGCSVDSVRQAEKMGHLAARFPNAKRRYHMVEVNWWLRGVSAPKKSGGIKCQQHP